MAGTGLKLIIGNKNYSSWSMRPWFAMRVAGIPFAETVIPIYREDSKARLMAVSASGKVPALVDGDITVWDSLAILEYLAETFPAARMWPSDRAARAHARAISAEMHSGFQALRVECAMNMHRPIGVKPLSPDASDNIARIHAVWTDCRARYGSGGPFLFGAFTAADAMYAPVVSRFETYAIPGPAPVAAYMETIRALPAWKEWRSAALAEEWVIDKYENG
jgi:glutathione S-transferase